MSLKRKFLEKHPLISRCVGGYLGSLNAEVSPQQEVVQVLRDLQPARNLFEHCADL